MKTLLAVLLLAVAAYADAPLYTAVYEASLVATAGVTTLQQPATPVRGGARLVGVKVYCSVACTATLEHSGTAATATANTANISKPPTTTTAPTLVFFTASDAGAGTVVDKYVLGAGDVEYIACGGGDCRIPRVAGANWTIRTSSITGDVKVTWFWRED